MGPVDYLSKNPFAKTGKILSYDENFVVATLSKIRGSLLKTNNLFKLNSPNSKPIK